MNTAKLKAKALALLTKYGTAITVRSITQGTYSATTGLATETNSDVSTYGLVDGVRLRYNGERYTSDSLVRIDDLFITVASLALSFTPKPGDKIQYNGDWLVAIGVQPLDPIPALYMIRVRR